jgi:hypothetical protein
MFNICQHTKRAVKDLPSLVNEYKKMLITEVCQAMLARVTPHIGLIGYFNAGNLTLQLPIQNGYH